MKEVNPDYYHLSIEPIQFIYKNKLNFLEGNVIKYICRHRKKNGVEDLKKAKRYVEMLAEMEYGVKI